MTCNVLLVMYGCKMPQLPVAGLWQRGWTIPGSCRPHITVNFMFVYGFGFFLVKQVPSCLFIWDFKWTT
jgi:hypothetical protein